MALHLKLQFYNLHISVQIIQYLCYKKFSIEENFYYFFKNQACNYSIGCKYFEKYVFVKSTIKMKARIIWDPI